MVGFEWNRILVGHILDKINEIPDNSVDMIVTSPPYWGLRDYGTELQIWSGNKDCEHRWGKEIIAPGSRSNDPGDKKYIPKGTRENFEKSNFCIVCNAWRGSLGLEPTFNLFIDHLIQIFEALRTKLCDHGSLWVNLGDTYYGGGNAQGHTGLSVNFGVSTLRRDGNQNPVARGVLNKIKRKSLVGIPDRFKIAMIDNGWVCRNDIIWWKRSCMPSSIKDRFTVDNERFFFFTKNSKYYFKQQFEPMVGDSIKRMNRGVGNNHKHVDATLYGQKTHTIHKPRDNIKNKYGSLDNETTYRQGMNKERGDKMIKKRNLPSQKEFVNKLREKYNIDDISQKTGITKSTVEHWFRYDESGFAFPTIENWVKFQQVYNTGTFNELVDYWEEPDDIKESVRGRNMRTTWDINLKGFSDSHFAIFPEKLIEVPIDAACPKKVCLGCGEPEKFIDSKIGEFQRRWSKNNKEDSPYEKQSSMQNIYETKKITCNCKADFRKGRVLDIFMGSGTTAIVAHKQDKDWLGIELNEKYVKMATKRILNNTDILLRQHFEFE